MEGRVCPSLFPLFSCLAEGGIQGIVAFPIRVPDSLSERGFVIVLLFLLFSSPLEEEVQEVIDSSSLLSLPAKKARVTFPSVHGRLLASPFLPS